jgi:membrane protein YqaA with SNARE-associated domain
MAFGDLAATVLEFVRAHPEWAALIVFVLAFGESLPFASLVLPFWAVLVGTGTIVGAADPLIFWLVVAAAAVGAALGDWLSYWLGRHYHEQVQNMWPLRNHPRLLERGRAFFKRWGIWAIVLARFRPAARDRAPGRGHRGDASVAVPDCKLDIGVLVGVRSPVARQLGNELAPGIPAVMGAAANVEPSRLGDYEPATELHLNGRFDGRQRPH